jgi:hypothetical protein
VFHDGLNSYITDNGEGQLYIGAYENPSTDYAVKIGNVANNQIYAGFNHGTSVDLFFNNSKKLATTASGIDVTGTVQADQYDNDEALPDIRPSLLLDFANSKTLDPRITFTRGSTATYYDGKTTAKAEENLLSYSQQFNNGYWTVAGGSATADATTAPDGTTTADTITAAAGTAVAGIQRAAFTFTGGQVVTISIYAKAGTNNYFQIGGFNTPLANVWANYDLSTGSLGTVGSSATASITDVGNGWYRCSLTGTVLTTSDGFFIDLIQSASATRHPILTWAGTESVHFWGAQIEYRSAATAYTPTTDSPIVKYQPVLQTAASGAARFDHDPVTGESKGLLIEEARTNLFTYSSEFDNAAWANNDTTITPNTAVAPDGTLTADKLIADTDNNFHFTSELFSSSGNTAYTLSVFAKTAGYSKFFLQYNTNAEWVGSDNTKIVFDLASGAITASQDATGTITDVGNGWYRCTITATTESSTSNTTANIHLIDGSGNASFTGDGYSGIYIWGAQLEAGSFPTSYIATAGSTVTRAQDDAEITDISFLNPTELTVYFESEQCANDSYRRYFAFGDNTGGPMEYAIFSNPTNNITSYVRVNGVNQAEFQNGGSIAEGVAIRAAISIAEGKVAMSINGASAGTDTTVNLAGVNLTRLRIGRGEENASNRFPDKPIKKLAVYPKVLSDATLQAMTTE